MAQREESIALLERVEEDPRELVVRVLAECDRYEPSDWRPGEKAASLIAALAGAGYVIVPRRATKAMLNAYADYRKRILEADSFPTVEGIWDDRRKKFGDRW